MIRIIKNICRYILNNSSLYFFVFLIIFSFDRHHRLEAGANPDMAPFEYDVAEYYAFLPALFYGNTEHIDQTFINNKRTIGMAIMYTPAFYVGDLIARNTGELQNGYSKPYRWAIRWESIIICILGLFICRKNLLLFFSDTVVTISLVCIFFGTNLFYYTYSAGELPHSYLFFLYAAFIFLSLKLILEDRYKNLLWLGLIGGMITLIRPTDALILLFPLLFKTGSLNKVKARITTTLKHPYILIVSFLLFLFPLILQLSIWKYFIGDFFFYSYKDEGFFFKDPQIINFLFSYRKGWLLYTPLMIFSFIGILLSKKYLNDFFIFLLFFTISNIYILSCWWDWSFGGSFGCRVLIQAYAIFIFPLALVISCLWNLFKTQKIQKSIFRIFVTTVLAIIIKLNLFQSWQYRWHLIHWCGMNEKAYKYVFLKENLKEGELEYIQTLVTPPDTYKMLKGERDLK